MEHIFQKEQFGEDWFTFPDLYSRMVKKATNGSIFVEVGSWKGKSSAYMATEIINSNKDIQFFCVDTWKGSIEHEGMELGNLYETFLNNMKPLESYYFPLKITSIEASKKFKDNSLDFVFLDASHEYEDVKTDILAWLPKLKSGGVLAGHDYYKESETDCFPGVSKATDELLNNFEIVDDCFVFYKDKLRNFPPVNFISIEESQDRRDLLAKKFNSYGIKNLTGHVFERYKEGDCNLFGEMVIDLKIESKGPVTSHLKAIKDWYNNTNEPYAFFCEDDLSLDTVKYWNFTWEEFFARLPKDWGCIQLAWIRDEFFKFGYKLRNRCWCDWSGCAYLISREHARKLIESYHYDDNFHLDFKGSDTDTREDWAKVPVIETVIFSPVTKVYSFPMFVEDVILCNSTYQESQGDMHFGSHHNTIEFWKKKGKYSCLSELINNSTLH
jgi:hypothetical protein